MKAYIQENKDRFLAELFELLRIPSVSADSKYNDAVAQTAQLVAQRLTDAGAENVEIFQTKGHPIVYGEKFINPNVPTVLVYGHYDVQPADPIELWHTAPFEPTIIDGKIVARGASDDKGQMYMHVKAFETLMKNNALTCNVKFLIEGEEEVGSPNLAPFIIEYKNKLAADVVLISDTEILSNEHPSITSGLRGLSYMEVEVTGPSRDLHSGRYGGAVANPINILCDLIASLHDKDGRITVEGFYDKVLEVSTEERKKMAEALFSQQEFNDYLEIAEEKGEKGFSTPERIAIRPTLDVNGIWGGYIGEGAKTVIASKAYAKISMRLVPNQSSDEISNLFTKHFTKIAPKSVKVKVTPHHGGEPVVTPTDSVPYKAAEKAFEEVWGKTPIPMREGGSIPIVALFKKELGINTVLMGFGLGEDAIHSPNESYGLFNYFIGIETICSFYKQFSELSKA